MNLLLNAGAKSAFNAIMAACVRAAHELYIGFIRCVGVCVRVSQVFTHTRGRSEVENRQSVCATVRCVHQHSGAN